MWRLILLFLPAWAQACDRPICAVPPQSITFAREVTFDDQPSGFGPGRPFAEVIEMGDVAFGEHFAGQSLSRFQDFDRVTGHATAPLRLRAGEESRNLTIIRLADTNVLSGYGPTGYPNHSATGEGAIAVQFQHEQIAVGFDIRGGEEGFATVTFLARDGSVIDSHLVGPLAEEAYAFEVQQGAPEISGLIITNEDPDGIALDTVSFEAVEQTS